MLKEKEQASAPEAEKKEEEKIESRLTPKEREALIKGGLSLMNDNPGIAREFFKLAELTDEQIEVVLSGKEEEKKKEKAKSILEDEEEKKQMRKDVEKLYKQMIEIAKREGNEEKIKLYENALEALKEKG